MADEDEDDNEELPCVDHVPLNEGAVGKKSEIWLKWFSLSLCELVVKMVLKNVAQHLL
jgi:hypothetical protein